MAVQTAVEPSDADPMDGVDSSLRHVSMDTSRLEDCPEGRTQRAAGELEGALAAAVVGREELEGRSLEHVKWRQEWGEESLEALSKGRPQA